MHCNSTFDIHTIRCVVLRSFQLYNVDGSQKMTNDKGEYPEMMTYIFWNLILVAKTLNNNVDAVVDVDVVVECWCCVTCYDMNHRDSMIVFRNNYWISSILWLCETHRHLFEDWVANQGQTAEFANENNWWRLLWMLQGKIVLREYIKNQSDE